MRNRNVFRRARSGYIFRYRRGEDIKIVPSVVIYDDKGKMKVVPVRDLPQAQRARAEMDSVDKAADRREKAIEVLAALKAAGLETPIA
jgi:hypothetical protein